MAGFWLDTVANRSLAAADAGHDDNRGQKGGYGRVRLEGKKKKHTSHCFYCTAQPGEGEMEFRFYELVHLCRLPSHEADSR